MGKCITLTIVYLVATHILEKNGNVSAFGKRRGGLRRAQNSRTRFQQRINRLGPNKVELLKAGKLGMNRGLPSGFAMVGGQLLDYTNKVIQKTIPGGTAYFTFQDKLGSRPLYIRPGQEAGWNYVLFQDPFYWRGSGHLILLKKVLGVNINQAQFQSAQRNHLYEAYILSLRVSLHPRVNIKDPFFRKKIQKRRRKFERVQLLRKQYRKPGNRPHLTDRKIKIEKKREQRSVVAITYFDNDQGISRGDCILSRLNVTSVMLTMENSLNKNTTNVVTHKQHHLPSHKQDNPL